MPDKLLEKRSRGVMMSKPVQGTMDESFDALERVIARLGPKKPAKKPAKLTGKLAQKAMKYGSVAAKKALGKALGPAGIALDLAAAGLAAKEGYKAKKALEHTDRHAKGLEKRGMTVTRPEVSAKDVLGMMFIPGYNPQASDVRKLKVRKK